MAQSTPIKESLTYRSLSHSAMLHIKYLFTLPSPFAQAQGRAYATAPLHVRLIERFLASPLYTLFQAYGPFILRGWPMAPLKVIDWLATRIGKWTSNRTTWHIWRRADSGHPNEIGFHTSFPAEEDGSRPRVYYYSNTCPTLAPSINPPLNSNATLTA